MVSISTIWLGVALGEKLEDIFEKYGVEYLSYEGELDVSEPHFQKIVEDTVLYLQLRSGHSTWYESYRLLEGTNLQKPWKIPHNGKFFLVAEFYDYDSSDRSCGGLVLFPEGSIDLKS